MRRTKRIPLTAEELTPINARLREAYRMVNEVGGLIHGRVKSALETKHRNMCWQLRSVGENLNDRIDWMKTGDDDD